MSQVLTKRAFPRISTVDRYAPGGCRFHVANSPEAYRVEKFGGEEEFTQMILDELRPDDLFFDIGACIGFVSIHAATRAARVFAFEPDPAFRLRLQENLELNQVQNVEVIDWAASDSTGQTTLYTDGLGGLSPCLRQTGAERGRVSIRTDSIDNAIADGALPTPTVAKIDIEGAETAALRGMKSLLSLAAAPRTIFIELHPKFLPTFGSSIAEASQIIERAGYQCAYEQARAEQVHRIYRRAA